MTPAAPGPEVSAAAVIVAAGEGERCPGEVRKQFRRVGGDRVLERTCRVFGTAGCVDRIVVVVPEDVAEAPPEWLREAADRLVAGGLTRRASVGRGVEAVPEAYDIILVHDGVRPFVSVELIETVARKSREAVVTPVLPLTDTVVEVDQGDRVVAVPERSRLRRVQTPQGFPANVLRQAHRRARREGTEATDDAGLCHALGYPVTTVPGERRNLKLTTADDFRRAERWLVVEGAE